MDFIDKCIQLDPKIKASSFIDDVILLAIRIILRNHLWPFFFAQQVYFKWAKSHGSKFALKKYQLVHLTCHYKDNFECKLDLKESEIIKEA